MLFDSCNPFQSEKHWNDLSESEYHKHTTKNYNPNKSKEYFNKKKNNKPFFTISKVLQTFVKEFIALYTIGNNLDVFNNPEHECIKYSWDFIGKRDPEAFEYFINKTKARKFGILNLSTVVFVICRSFWRKNSTIYTLDVAVMHRWIYNQVETISKWKEADRNKFRTELYSLRGQIRTV